MPNYSGLWTRQAQLQAVTVPNWPGPPGVPTGVTATVVNGTSVSVAFTAPAYTGNPPGITGYRVTSSPGGITATGASSPITVTGLTTNQAYTFTVAAQNTLGYGSESAASNSVTPVNDYIEDVFSTYLYTGIGATQTITNGIDLSGKGGLVWIKNRVSGTTNHILVDTVRGADNRIFSNLTNVQSSGAGGASSFLSTGFTTSDNASGNTFVSWTFREQPKFFDVVTYTGNGTSQNISHNLGSVPGCILVKCTNTARSWAVYHRSLGNASAVTLNNTTASRAFSGWNNTTPTNSVFSVGADTDVNGAGNTYVAYLFAHDAGGFGATGADNVISCGSYTGSATDWAAGATLGYEPQWVLIKNITSGTANWNIFDNMRGMFVSAENDPVLFPNLSNAEEAYNLIRPTATGFEVANSSRVGGSGNTCIYIAIRRGPMKTPTTGTSVFTPVARTGTGAATTSTAGFPVDWSFIKTRTVSGQSYQATRLTANAYLQATNTNAETTIASTYPTTVFQSNTLVNLGSTDVNDSGRTYVDWFFRRAPGFFDVVCYTGTDSSQTLNHNLGVAPEMIIVKRRNGGGSESWVVQHSGLTGGIGQGANSDYIVYLNSTNAEFDSDGTFNFSPTTTTFSLQNNSNDQVNDLSGTYIAYLFASCPGVSKVGSYTGTGTTLQINCGFTGGARFVLIKRADSTGDWYVWDSARGIVAGNDPYLLMNSSAAEVTNTDYVDTYAAGFEISSTAPAAINANGGTYLYLAIA